MTTQEFKMSAFQPLSACNFLGLVSTIQDFERQKMLAYKIFCQYLLYKLNQRQCKTSTELLCSLKYKPFSLSVFASVLHKVEVYFVVIVVGSVVYTG